MRFATSDSNKLRSSINNISQELDFAMTGISKGSGYVPRVNLDDALPSRKRYARTNLSSSRDFGVDVSEHLRRLRESVDRRVQRIGADSDSIRVDRLGEKMKALVDQSSSIVNELEVDMAAKVSLLKDSVQRRMEAIDRIQKDGVESNLDSLGNRESRGLLEDVTESRVETRAAEMLVKPVLSDSDPDNNDSRKASDGNRRRLRKGSRVEARFLGRGRWLRGRIRRVHSDGKYHVDFDDGRSEKRVRRHLVRPYSLHRRRRRRKERRARATRFKVGQKIEAYDPDRKRWREAEVATIHSDDSVTVRFVESNNGDAVDERFLRLERRKVRKLGFDEGDVVEARFRGKRKWLPAKVVRVHDDGKTYDVAYDKGEIETRVSVGMIRFTSDVDERDDEDEDEDRSDESDVSFDSPLPNDTRSLSSERSGSDERDDGDASGSGYESDDELNRRTKSRWHVGDEVRLRSSRRRRGRSSKGWRRGKVIARRANGRYDVRCASGRIKRGVRASRLSARSKHRRTDDDDDDDDDASDEVSEENAVSSSDEGRRKMFSKGSLIEARYKGRRSWRPGHVSRVHTNGTFDIVYSSSGRVERRVRRRDVRERRRSSERGAEDFEKGDSVEVRGTGRGANTRWLCGIVIRVRDRGMYDVRLEDGDERKHVNARSSMRFVRFDVGEKVRARFEWESRWSHGEVIRTHDGDGTYDVKYDDDGRIERRVEARRMRPFRRRRVDAFQKGAAVEARYQGRQEWSKARIQTVNEDGTFDLKFEDGSEEFGVVSDLIRKRLVKGAAVMAQYGGKKRWFPGKIVRARENGTFDVLYADGERETHVDPEFIRPRVFAYRDRVEARYRGRKRWKRGFITLVRGDGSYDIEYDDGTTEECVEVELVRYVRFYFGERVLARFDGRKRWLPGKIDRVHNDGTLNIRYDNGETENRIEAGMVRRMRCRFTRGTIVEARSEGGLKWSRGVVERVNGDETYDVKYDIDGNLETHIDRDYVRMIFMRGDHVEARFEGRKRWFRGVVTRSNGDGTYDLRYDDGDAETGVEAELMRFVVFEVGDEVEIRVESGKKWVRGSIVRIHEDDASYDVEFDSGDLERRVEGRRLRPFRKSTSDSALTFERGMAVEARYDGRRKWFAGIVRHVNDDGTLDINYDDGDKERGIETQCVRPKRLSKGDAVEARFGRRKLWLRGKIAAAYDDATYKIVYDSGDAEDEVPHRFVRYALVVGSAVRAKSVNSGWWKSGRITEVHGRNDAATFDVRFRSGETARGLTRENVRGFTRTFPVQSVVEVLPAHTRDVVDVWSRGKIVRVRDDGTYDVEYEDGRAIANNGGDTVEMGVEGRRIRFVLYSEGDRVEARFGGRKRWFAGTILAAYDDDATYRVKYDDGDVEDDVPHNFVRFKMLVGSTVRAKGGTRPFEWRSGRVSASHDESTSASKTFDITFRDGDTALRVSRDDLESIFVRKPNDALKHVTGSIVTSLEGTMSALKQKLSHTDRAPALVSDAALSHRSIFKNVETSVAYTPLPSFRDPGAIPSLEGGEAKKSQDDPERSANEATSVVGEKDTAASELATVNEPRTSNLPAASERVVPNSYAVAYAVPTITTPPLRSERSKFNDAASWFGRDRHIATGGFVDALP
eukprot:g2666.t1